jgi:pimeloyl-ACP methyl ester carboxylesterase
VNPLVVVIAAAGALLLAMALVAPLESLRWWARAPATSTWDVTTPVECVAASSSVKHWVVWLSGIGSFTGDRLAPYEQRFLNELSRCVPGVHIHSDDFVYSVENNPLTGRRALARLWRFIQARTDRNPGDVTDVLVHIHNLLQVAVSADSRYGPIYNLGVAQSIRARLIAHGYPTEQHLAITLIGYSGGAQIAIEAGAILRRCTGSPVHVLSVGGVIAAGPGLIAIDSLTMFLSLLLGVLCPAGKCKGSKGKTTRAPLRSRRSPEPGPPLAAAVRATDATRRPDARSGSRQPPAE